jgi:hypothetical protein
MPKAMFIEENFVCVKHQWRKFKHTMESTVKQSNFYWIPLSTVDRFNELGNLFIISVDGDSWFVQVGS